MTRSPAGIALASVRCLAFHCFPLLREGIPIVLDMLTPLPSAGGRYRQQIELVATFFRSGSGDRHRELAAVSRRCKARTANFPIAEHRRRPRRTSSQRHPSNSLSRKHRQPSSDDHRGERAELFPPSGRRGPSFRASAMGTRSRLRPIAAPECAGPSVEAIRRPGLLPIISAYPRIHH